MDLDTKRATLIANAKSIGDAFARQLSDAQTDVQLDEIGTRLARVVELLNQSAVGYKYQIAVVAASAVA